MYQYLQARDGFRKAETGIEVLSFTLNFILDLYIQCLHFRCDHCLLQMGCAQRCHSFSDKLNCLTYIGRLRLNETSLQVELKILQFICMKIL
jgi:hypothetical protein